MLANVKAKLKKFSQLNLKKKLMMNNILDQQVLKRKRKKLKIKMRKKNLMNLQKFLINLIKKI